ncbi:MAG: class I SAM-dependent methyltransferase [Candidatus Kariarchaeaceae archaeon]|jgi:SAM-dependent methyltransferase
MGNPIDRSTLFDILIREFNFPFSGWDFSHIRDRMETAPLPWSYTSKILYKLPLIGSLLDMGTGGGEFLHALQPLPVDTHATESFEPNIPIAKKRLAEVNVEVHAFQKDNELPFDSEYFDLIINRHESYDPVEVNRILKQNGQFITQQVGGSNDNDLNQLLGAETDPTYAHWNMQFAVNQLEETGFTVVEQHEAFPLTRIFDVGSIVYYLKAIPWQIPDFSIEKYKDKLLEIHDKIQTSGFIEVRSHYFLIIAEKRPPQTFDEATPQSRVIAVEDTS